MIMLLFSLLLVLITLFSYAFVEANLPSFNVLYTGFANTERIWITILYTVLVFLLTGFYLFFLKVRKTISLKKIIIATVVLLFFAYPAMLSYDIFNYITTAKVLFFYGENPYIVMPIEFVDEPNLAFTRAANKIALYGPSWLLLTGIPFMLGFGNIVMTVFSFKLCIIMFYLATLYLIFKMSQNSFSVLFFGLNPLVLLEIVVSGHNDIVTIFFALLAFYLVKKNNIALGFLALLFSIGIKYATLALLPIFIYVAYRSWQKKKIQWEKIYFVASIAMFLVFLAAPLREEIYPWYAVWILGFVALIPRRKLLSTLTVVLSISLLLRYIPVLYTGSYFGQTPLIKTLVTFIPIILVLLLWPIFKRKLFINSP